MDFNITHGFTGTEIIHGDTLHVLKSFPDKLFGGILTDPPYASGAADQNAKQQSTGAKYSSMHRSGVNPFYYCRYARVDESLACYGLRIQESEIEEVLFESLAKQAQVVLAVDRIGCFSDLDARLVRQTEWERQEQQLQDHKRGLYERYLLEELGLAEYKALKAQIDAELLHVKQLRSSMEAQTRLARKEKVEKEKSLEFAQHVSSENGLTQSLSDLFVARVNVYPSNTVEVSWRVLFH